MLLTVSLGIDDRERKREIETEGVERRMARRKDKAQFARLLRYIAQRSSLWIGVLLH